MAVVNCLMAEFLPFLVTKAGGALSTARSVVLGRHMYTMIPLWIRSAIREL